MIGRNYTYAIETLRKEERLLLQALTNMNRYDRFDLDPEEYKKIVESFEARFNEKHPKVDFSLRTNNRKVEIAYIKAFSKNQ